MVTTPEEQREVATLKALASDICSGLAKVKDSGSNEKRAAFNTSSSGVVEIGASGTVTKEIWQKIVLLPTAPKFGTQEVNRFSQSPA